MIEIDNYISRLKELLKSRFDARMLYIGLQGSYLRGEATKDSDIDIVVILDELTTADLDCYRSIIQSLEYTNKSCGFICGKSELEKWNTLEIHHLLNSTKDYYGALSELVPNYTMEDVRNHIKLSVNNIYHAICHSYVHGKKEENKATLPMHYKGTFFILQNLYYLNHSSFAKTKAELLPLLSGKDHAVLKRSMEFGNGATCDFAQDFDLLFTWCQEIMQTI